MATREYGKNLFSTWTDEHFICQPTFDKLLYQVLIGQPPTLLNHAGVQPFSMRRWRKAMRDGDTMPAEVPTPVAGHPLSIRIDFVMPRPASAPKRRTPAAIRRPDTDKLARAVLDALTGIWFTDDSAITDLHATKRLAELGETPGAHITLETVSCSQELRRSDRSDRLL